MHPHVLHSYVHILCMMHSNEMINTTGWLIQLSCSSKRIIIILGGCCSVCTDHTSNWSSFIDRQDRYITVRSETSTHRGRFWDNFCFTDPGPTHKKKKKEPFYL